ncbi:MAG: hypothetical protein IPG06_00455 [Haliea sp.]|nr:hypothetical protein [Haliea sp.]
MQLLMSAEDIRSFMYSRSAEQILAGIGGGAGMYTAPQGFRDGTVLPKKTLYQVFRDPDHYNSVRRQQPATGLRLPLGLG